MLGEALMLSCVVMSLYHLAKTRDLSILVGVAQYVVVVDALVSTTCIVLDMKNILTKN